MSRISLSNDGSRGINQIPAPFLLQGSRGHKILDFSNLRRAGLGPLNYLRVCSFTSSLILIGLPGKLLCLPLVFGITLSLGACRSIAKLY